MSPSVAPESEEPYWAIASFSSAISSALIDTEHLAGAAVELGDARVDLLADREPLRPLLAAVARQIGAPDEGLEIGADDLHVDAALLHLGHLAGHHRALLEVAGGAGVHRIAFELLDAERDALLLDVDVEHLGA